PDLGLVYRQVLGGAPAAARRPQRTPMSVKEPAAREVTAPFRLFVVARRGPELYGYLRARFADEAGVSVVLDRRVEARRRRALPAAAERRRARPRTPREIDRR